MSIVIVANGGANIASLQFALERLGSASEVSADAARIRAATHVILPGVGAAADAMTRLRNSGLDALIPTLTQPVLGICLGMQLLHEASAEGATRCLGIIPGAASRFVEAPGRPVPHMGWNTLTVERSCPLLSGVASCRYGASFSACVAWRNFYGAQFHPERSAGVGARLLRNFLQIGAAPALRDVPCA